MALENGPLGICMFSCNNLCGMFFPSLGEMGGSFGQVQHICKYNHLLTQGSCCLPNNHYCISALNYSKINSPVFFFLSWKQTFPFSPQITCLVSFQSIFICKQLVQWARVNILLPSFASVSIGWCMKQRRRKWKRRRCFCINASKGHKKQMEYHCIFLSKNLGRDSRSHTFLEKKTGTHRSRINIFRGQVRLIGLWSIACYLCA